MNEKTILTSFLHVKMGTVKIVEFVRFFAGTSPQEVYYDYIIGKREFLEISQTLIVANKIQCLLTDCKLLKHCIFICNQISY